MEVTLKFGTTKAHASMCWKAALIAATPNPP